MTEMNHDERRYHISLLVLTTALKRIIDNPDAFISWVTESFKTPPSAPVVILEAGFTKLLEISYHTTLGLWELNINVPRPRLPGDYPSISVPTDRATLVLRNVNRDDVFNISDVGADQLYRVYEASRSAIEGLVDNAEVAVKYVEPIHAIRGVEKHILAPLRTHPYKNTDLQLYGVMPAGWEKLFEFKMNKAGTGSDKFPVYDVMITPRLKWYTGGIFRDWLTDLHTFSVHVITKRGGTDRETELFKRTLTEQMFNLINLAVNDLTDLRENL